MKPGDLVWYDDREFMGMVLETGVQLFSSERVLVMWVGKAPSKNSTTRKLWNLALPVPWCPEGR